MSAIARCTSSAVAGSTFRVWLMTCETVDIETPASRATSAMVANGSPPSPLCEPERIGTGHEPSERGLMAILGSIEALAQALSFGLRGYGLQLRAKKNPGGSLR